MPATVLLNRGGGAVAADSDIAAKVATALADAGIEADVELVGGGDCAVRCTAIAERGDELLIVGGGDGTIGAAASALVGTKTRLGILPLGTLNHFARDLGIPTDLAGAAGVIAKGKPRRVDVAEMNGRIFINNSAIGLYPLMVVDRDLQQKRLGRSKRLAMVVASFRTLARFNHQRLALTVNKERKARLDTPLLFVGNNQYRIDLGAPGQRDRIDGGELCVMVMRKNTRAGLHRRERPRLVQPLAARRHGRISTESSACGSAAIAAVSRCRWTARWSAPSRRSTIASARKRFESSPRVRTRARPVRCDSPW